MDNIRKALNGMKADDAVETILNPVSYTHLCHCAVWCVYVNIHTPDPSGGTAFLDKEGGWQMETTEYRIPAVALRGMVVLPEMVTHFDVSRSRSVSYTHLTIKRKKWRRYKADCMIKHTFVIKPAIID